MDVRIKLLPHCFASPEYKTQGAVGADVYATEDTVLHSMTARTVPLGFCIEIPLGWGAEIRPRSGMTKRAILCQVGTIDMDYRGEVGATLINLGASQKIHRGDRIAQLVISPIVQCVFHHVESLSATERGENGFGSTGV